MWFQCRFVCVPMFVFFLVLVGGGGGEDGILYPRLKVSSALHRVCCKVFHLPKRFAMVWTVRVSPVLKRTLRTQHNLEAAFPYEMMLSAHADIS